MKAFIFQHVPFESPAAILDWLQTKAFEVHYVHFYESHSLPSIQEVDWLIIMGGPMSVNDEKELSWLVNEKRYIKECISAGKVVVGVCLGAQLIANTLGSKVYPGKDKEIGWYPVRWTENVNIKLPSVQKENTVFHWHGETFDLPKGAILLASSEGCKNQIFTYGNNVLAMQCHLEMTPEAIEEMLKDCGDEIQPAKYIQPVEDILANTNIHASGSQKVLFGLLNNLLAVNMRPLQIKKEY